MRLVIAAFAATVAIATPIVAQQMQLPGSKNKAAITGGSYTVDPGHTLVRWEVDHFGFTPYWGLFGGITGTATFDKSNPAASKVDITIPVSKVITANEDLTSHLLSPGKDGRKPDFFGAAPADAKFVSTSVVVDEDGDEAKVTGNLTLNGVTRPVTLDVDFYGAGKTPQTMGGKENVGFEAETTIRRSDFGINFAIPLVSDEVDLKIAAAFVK
ncbi:MAG TPA: YceI family protein [Sphingomonas sp.]|jgi:polyisoprenoid-binding protein YceI|nr:YceI family protein [Sphingomonas sp.]